MIAILLITVPLFFGIFSFCLRNNSAPRTLIIACAGVHLGLSCLAWIKGTRAVLNAWFVFDNVGVVFLAITSVLFFGTALYVVKHLSDETKHISNEEERHRAISRESVFIGCLLLFLSAMTIVIGSQQLALLWVGIEATTLASAPLIYFHRTKSSLEATWKYLLICSVGIAIALLGIFFLAAANNNCGELLLMRLIDNAKDLNVLWLKAAFLLLFVGYGTKMGLAPFHTWLPDAHSEAPSAVSALLSGALLNCAFLGILRVYQICAAAGLGAYCREIFVFFGVLSIFFAAVFILRQADYKRMLAYSSVEHMGIITFGVGLGGSAVFGSLVNMIGHSLTKAGLFFVAGNILSHFRTKKISDVRAIMDGKVRRSGALWIFGFLLITGTPPSAIFMGKFIILREVFSQSRYWTGVFFLGMLAIVFIGMAKIFISMTQGSPADENRRFGGGNYFWRELVPASFFVLVVSIGIYCPVWLTRAIEEAAKKL